MAPDGDISADLPVDQRALSKLKWRCRRGLLENDLFIERFFARHEDSLTMRHAQALSRLMDLSDNDLLDIHLGRRSAAEVDPSLDTADIARVVNMLQRHH